MSGVEVVQVRRYKVGYEVRTEHIPAGESGCDEAFDTRSAYTPEGHYIGDPKTARHLIVKMGIKPEPANGGAGPCSIGFNAEEQRWYGWSHRAICGFSIGDVAEEGDCVCSSGWTDEYLAEHPEEDTSLPMGFEAKTTDDAKRMAIAFAESVS